MKNVLVTGGAGYIGSHTALQLIEAGHNVVVLDNLYSGHRWAVPEGATFVEGDIADSDLVARTVREHGIESAIHFAAFLIVPESVSYPGKYYRNNVNGSLNLIEACIDNGVREFVFSSSAATYGVPDENPITESAPQQPINPYGTTKLIMEWVLRDLAAASKNDFRYVVLRYFNVAGAHTGGRIGQATPDATHLIKVACEAATGSRDGMAIYGDDYPTPDGTCVRDYIHVDDLARAHLDALDYMGQGGDSIAMNCGYGHGYSVSEVVDRVKAVSGVDFEVRMEGRRAGDPPELVADSRLLKERLGWQPRHDDLDLICRTAYEWERSMLDRKQTGSA